MERIDEGINKTIGENLEDEKIEYAKDRVRYIGKNKNNENIDLYILKKEYLQNLDIVNLERELKESIRRNFDYLFEKYDFLIPDRWAFLYGMWWYALFSRNDFKRSPGMRILDNNIQKLYPEKLEEIEKGEVRIRIKETIDTLEANKDKPPMLIKGELVNFLQEGYRVEPEDISWFLDHVIWSLNNFADISSNIAFSEDILVLRFDAIKRGKNGSSYYEAIRITNEDVSKVKVEIINDTKTITDIEEIWFAYPIKIYKLIKHQEKGGKEETYYDIKISDDERKIMTQKDIIKKLREYGSGLSKYRVEEAFLKILQGLRIEGKLKEIVARYPAPGIYLKDDGSFDFAISMDDGVFPSSDKAEAYQEMLERKGMPDDEQMKNAMDFILKVLTLVKDPIERVNTLLLFGWGLIAPFHYVFRETGRMGHYFINYGVKNSGKTLRANLLTAGYGGFNAPGGDTFNSVFRLGIWAEASTFPILADDIKGLSDVVLRQIKGGVENSEIIERGMQNQTTKKYKSLTSFLFTCQDIDWLISKKDKEASAQMDRFIIGLEETKTKMVNDMEKIDFEGISYSGDSLKERAKKLPPWALRVIKEFVENLNRETGGVRGLAKLDRILANISNGIRIKLEELGVDKEITSRELEKLSRIYAGLQIFIKAIKKYLPWWKDYEKDLSWLFDMEDQAKFVGIMAKNWLGMLEFSSIFERYLLDIKKAYDYLQAYYKDEARWSNLLTKTGYNFSDDIVEDGDNLLITPLYIKKAKVKFERERIGGYTTLSAFAKDYAKALKKDLSEIYMSSPKEINGKRPRVVKIRIEDLYTYLSREG